MKAERINNHIIITAEKGMICTDGKDTYGTPISLAEGVSADAFWEIPMEEYRATLEPVGAEIPE